MERFLKEEPTHKPLKDMDDVETARDYLELAWETLKADVRAQGKKTWSKVKDIVSRHST